VRPRLLIAFVLHAPQCSQRRRFHVRVKLGALPPSVESTTATLQSNPPRKSAPFPLELPSIFVSPPDRSGNVAPSKSRAAHVGFPGKLFPSPAPCQFTPIIFADEIRSPS